MNDKHRLRAAGNAVVPQQAFVAGLWTLRLMTTELGFKRRGETT